LQILYARIFGSAVNTSLKKKRKKNSYAEGRFDLYSFSHLFVNFIRHFMIIIFCHFAAQLSVSERECTLSPAALSLGYSHLPRPIWLAISDPGE